MHAVEPQAHLGQLDGGGVEVHAVALVDGEMSLGLLQLKLVLVGVDRLAELVLCGLEVTRSQLVDGLVEEGAAPKGRFADCQSQDLCPR